MRNLRLVLKTALASIESIGLAVLARGLSVSTAARANCYGDRHGHAPISAVRSPSPARPPEKSIQKAIDHPDFGPPSPVVLYSEIRTRPDQQDPAGV